MCLEGLELADGCSDHKASIDILIGSDHYWNIVTGDLITGDHGPVAVSSKLGWLLSGPIDSRTCSNIFHSHVIITDGYDQPAPSQTDQLFRVLKSFWDTESIGIRSDQELNHIPSRCTFWSREIWSQITMERWSSWCSNPFPPLF